MKFSNSLILASASPRRKQLMEEAGYKFRVFVSDIDESAFQWEGLNSWEYAKNMAAAKARDVARKFPDCIVIGADTVVDFNGETIGKPADERDAEQIVKKLFSSAHKVITAVAIVRLSDGTEIVETDTTIVYPKKMSEEEITEHIKSRLWKDKAGAYAIQENGDRFVEKTEGSITNVMGMPMELLQKLLGAIID
jgi:septum formation protein